MAHMLFKVLVGEGTHCPLCLSTSCTSRRAREDPLRNEHPTISRTWLHSPDHWPSNLEEFRKKTCIHRVSKDLYSDSVSLTHAFDDRGNKCNTGCSFVRSILRKIEIVFVMLSQLHLKFGRSDRFLGRARTFLLQSILVQNRDLGRNLYKTRLRNVRRRSFLQTMLTA